MDQQNHNEIPEEQAFTPEPESTQPEPRKQFKLFNPDYKLPRRIFLVLAFLVIFSVIGFIVYTAFDLPPMHEVENPQSDLSTQIISADGKILQKFYSRENRVNVKLNEISPYVIDALLATEDVRFYGHSGIDPQSFISILKSAVTGGGVRGGSTIDMQLTRNLYGEEVGNQSTIVRKIKEYLVSAVIERRFTKREIMAAYLNTVNIYGTSYGIETTANRLFDKHAKDLTIEESAMLVGMLKGQGVYNPIRYPDRTKARRDLVINQMVKYGFVDSVRLDVDSIKAIPIKVARQSQEHVKGIAPYFREHLRGELNAWCKQNGYDLYTDGLRVYTTLDTRMQKHAEEAVRVHLGALQKDFDRLKFGSKDWRKDSASIAKMFNSSRWKNFWKKNNSISYSLLRRSDRYQSGLRNKKSKEEIEAGFKVPVEMTLFSWFGDINMTITPLDSIQYYAGMLETGFASIDPSNGYVKAWVGGIDYVNFKYDHVAKGKRQVGSTFKPFVYATAIAEDGFTPCDKLLNQPVFIPDGTGKVWSPKNSDGKVGGKMTLRRGLATSTNLITASLMKKVGAEAVTEKAYAMGIETKLDPVPSLALGTTDLSVLELTSAYCTFPNKGVAVKPSLLTRIEDRYGNVIAEFSPEYKGEVLSEDKAFMMVELLRGVVDQPGGTAHRLRFRYKFDFEIGGKTGTTQNQSDGWFVGFTPDLANGAWVGCADRRMRFRSIRYGQGANMGLPIWAEYMKRVTEDEELGFTPGHFQVPENFDMNTLNCVEDSNMPKEEKKKDQDVSTEF